MAYPLNKKDYTKVLGMKADQRYQHLIDKVADFGEVWSLYSEDGWVVLMTEDDESCLPIWPHPDYASAWATGDWADCQPKAIELDEWMTRWIPGMKEDGTLLAVFPGDDEDGVVVTPEELAASLQEALS
ncbi:DUF2750 domain-containing protein [Pokkaliibacter sp. MBI-7]|uniref:DUF2750 domain-containing protein n=1 Tax=Proteobacteria bacterium 228 TaxID=2083153 RepID=A0A2S5KWF4_9PROT|nr:MULTISPECIES: DUF2750 domain-containing protein [Pokkaliibacter]MDH2431902.1 DUF2750 domain-containing protein [Pokkaliibacter sp. MBI-7]PPC79025.1 DUF2750 domain-containing protein [Pokkaliibacter plantistimulans]